MIPNYTCHIRVDIASGVHSWLAQSRALGLNQPEKKARHPKPIEAQKAPSTKTPLHITTNPTPLNTFQSVTKATAWQLLTAAITSSLLAARSRSDFRLTCRPARRVLREATCSFKVFTSPFNAFVSRSNLKQKNKNAVLVGFMTTSVCFDVRHFNMIVLAIRQWATRASTVITHIHCYFKDNLGNQRLHDWGFVYHLLRSLTISCLQETTKQPPNRRRTTTTEWTFFLPSS